MASRRRLPRAVPHFTGNNFIYPVRPAPFFAAYPLVGTPLLPTPLPGMNLNIPAAAAWPQHLANHAHCRMPTASETPAWPSQPPIPIEEGIVEIPTDTPLWTPGVFPPKPFGTPVPIQINPSLIPNPNNPTIPQLQWDILHCPEQARSYTGRSILKKVNLKETAVFPSTKKVWIFPHETNCPVLGYWMRRWGPIIIDLKGDLKVLDILDQVYKYFYVPLTDADLDAIEASRSVVNPKPMKLLRLAALKRAEDAYELPDYSTKQFRRIDVLGTFRCWGGVIPVVMLDGTWRLLLTLLPYPVPRVA
ncbi:hypothetical protein R3P38DRAFT_2842930 [Favolaschia claudopus]|uniref:DUF6699 domain-containing protein n=1 Tax=Favolaschia claudopus TaxID=2862362 RepID=A0AAW0E200_9AGAR